MAGSDPCRSAVDIPQSPAGMRQLEYGRHDAILDCIGRPVPKARRLGATPPPRGAMLPRSEKANRYSAPPVRINSASANTVRHPCSSARLVMNEKNVAGHVVTATNIQVFAPRMNHALSPMGRRQPLSGTTSGMIQPCQNTVRKIPTEPIQVCLRRHWRSYRLAHVVSTECSGMLETHMCRPFTLTCITTKANYRCRYRSALCSS